MKRFISFVLLMAMFCTIASADVFVKSLSEAYCFAFSLDGQHCLMAEPLPGKSDYCRLYIRHADGTVSSIVPTGLDEQAPANADTYFERCRRPRYGHTQVCGNTVMIMDKDIYLGTGLRWFVNLASGEAALLPYDPSSICGSRAALGGKGNRIAILDGESGAVTEQPIPEGLDIYAACPLENGVLLSARVEDGYALLWLDAQGNETHRLACQYAYENLYYDEASGTGLAARNSMLTWSWFNPYMIMRMQLPELTIEQADTKEKTIERLTSTQFYVSLTPENAKTSNRFPGFFPLGMMENGNYLLSLHQLGWLCTLNVATMQLTPLITANDNTDEILDLGHDLYMSIWNGGSLFCQPNKLQPYQYIELDHPALQ